MQKSYFYENFSSQIKEYEEKLKMLPEGQLLIARNGKYVKWYENHGHNPIYIPKKDKEYAVALAERGLCERKLSLLKEKSTVIEECNQKLKSIDDRFKENENDDFLSEFVYGQKREKRISWEHEEYPSNPNYPERLIHKTLAGGMVRSKSESIIANELFEAGIPYRYECALDIDNYCIYPDFTLLDPRTGNVKYWEHFGMMDDLHYRNKTFSKLETYADHDIIPGIDLIMTFETANAPLDVANVRNIIQGL